MARLMMIMAACGLLLLALAAGLVVYAVSGRGDGRAPSDRAFADLRIPEFTLTAQDGRTIGRADLLGRVTVVDFIFTNCPFICPVLTEQMGALSKEFEGAPVRFLSVSVDPEHDTPAALNAYAQRHGADLSRWTFAVGDQITLERLVTGGLKFALEPDPSTVIPTSDGGSMPNIVHPPWLVLLGPDAEVRGIYNAYDPERLEAIRRDARALVAELD